MASSESPFAGLEPVAKFTTRGFHSGESPDITLWDELREYASFGKRFRRLLNQISGNSRLGNPNSRAGHHVPVMGDGNFHWADRVSAIRMIAADVEINSACAGNRTHNSEIPCDFPAEDSSRLKAVLYGRRFQDQTCDVREFSVNRSHHSCELGQLAGIEIESQTSGNGYSAPVAGPTTLCGCLQQRFLEPGAIRSSHAEPNIRAEAANVRDV